jgi:hypothetical protein
VKKLLLWVVVLGLLGAGAYVAVEVPISGSTLLDRLLGRGLPEQVPAAAAAPATSPPKAPPAGQVQVPPPDTDQLTDRDRRGLDHLLDKKLDKEAKDAHASSH